MSTAQPILRFERMLAALERDLLESTDEEIYTIANELGMKPDMKGSVALMGITFAARLSHPGTLSKRQSRVAGDGLGESPSRRRLKGTRPSRRP